MLFLLPRLAALFEETIPIHDVTEFEYEDRLTITTPEGVELSLTSQQRDQIGSIMDRHHKRMQEITEAIHPQMRQELESANREIEAILTPEQRTKYNTMRMRLERFIPGHGRRRGGPPPPGM